MAVARYIVILAILAVLGAAVYVAMMPPGKQRMAAAEPTTAPATTAPGAVKDPRAAQLAQVEQLKTDITRMPDQLPLQIQLGRLLLEMHQTADAVKVLNVAFDRFITHAKEGHSADAKDLVHLRAALACAVLQAGDVTKAQQLAQEALAADLGDAQANAAMGNVLGVKKDFDEADKHFDLASARAPDDADILCDWGQMLMAADRARDAETRFRQACRVKQDGAKYYLWLGRSLRKQGRFGPAIRAEEGANSLSPRMSEPLVELGEIYEELKDYAKAETYFRAALSVDAASVDATTELAHVLMETPDPAQRNYLEAATLLASAVELTHGRNINLLAQQADATARCGFYEQAAACMDRAIAEAKQQNLPGNMLELLMQNAQKYAYLQSEQDRQADGVPESHSVLETPVPASANPFDNATPPAPDLRPRAIPSAAAATQGSR